MFLEDWALQWGIPPNAIEDLRKLYVMEFHPTGNRHGLHEAAMQNQYRFLAAQQGAVLWRNNVGAALDARGVPIRYGLANESKLMNAQWKSGDLIGIRPVKVTPEMVGTTIGRFISAEIKRQGWKYSGSVHERAQQNWIDLVVSLGGEANFVTGE
jgi:hypothetical protein